MSEGMAKKLILPIIQMRVRRVNVSRHEKALEVFSSLSIHDFDTFDLTADLHLHSCPMKLLTNILIFDFPAISNALRTSTRKIN